MDFCAVQLEISFAVELVTEYSRYINQLYSSSPVIFTARKRSLGRGNVLHLYVILFTGGGSHDGGWCPCPGGLGSGGSPLADPRVTPGTCTPQGSSWRTPWGKSWICHWSLSRGVSIQGVFCRGDPPPLW